MERETNRPINIAVIGAGNIATRHLKNLVFLGGNRIAANMRPERKPGALPGRYLRGAGIRGLGKNL